MGARVLGERRGEKYLADVFSAGANTIHDVLYKAQALEPIKSKLILPEVIDASRWYEGEHRYIDPEQRYIFAFVANSQPDRCNTIELKCILRSLVPFGIY